MGHTVHVIPCHLVIVPLYSTEQGFCGIEKFQGVPYKEKGCFHVHNTPFVELNRLSIAINCEWEKVVAAGIHKSKGGFGF